MAGGSRTSPDQPGSLASKLTTKRRGATFNTVVKLVRADLLRGLDLHAPGALLNTEILALARRQGATMIEVGVKHFPPAPVIILPTSTGRRYTHLSTDVLSEIEGRSRSR